MSRSALPTAVSAWARTAPAISAAKIFALMRHPVWWLLIPDDVEAKAAVEAAYHYQGPVYMRFGRLAVPVINDTPDYKFELGKGVTWGRR